MRKLATLPSTWPPHPTARFQSLSTLRETLSNTVLPPQLGTIIVRFVSQAIASDKPPDSSSWSSLAVWDEDSLQELCAFLVDALSGSFDDAVDNVTALTSHRPRAPRLKQQLSSNEMLMLSPEERAGASLELEHDPGDECQEEYNDHAEFERATIFEKQQPLTHALPAIREAFNTSHPAQLAVAHIFHFLLYLAVNERAACLRRTALVAISALSRALPSDLLASFLPGVTSGLVRILAACRLEHGTVVVAALDALVALVLSTFRDGVIATRKENRFAQVSFSDALARRSLNSASSALKPSTNDRSTISANTKVEPKRPSETNFITARDKSWTVRASREVSLRLNILLESHDGASQHTNVRVRQAVLRFARIFVALSSELNVSDRTRFLLRLVLFKACGDGYPIVQNEGVDAVLSLKKTGRLSLRDVERGIRISAKVLSSEGEGHIGKRAEVSRNSESSSESSSLDLSTPSQEDREEEEYLTALLRHGDENDLLQLCDGYIRILIPPEREEGWRSLQGKEGSSHLVRCLTRIGVEGFSRMLLAMLLRSWPKMVDPSGTYMAERDCRVLEVAFRLGRVGLLTILYPFLYRQLLHVSAESSCDFEESDQGADIGVLLQSFKTRSYAMLILQAVLRGAVARDLDDDIQLSDMQYFCQCTRELLYELGHFTLPCEEDGVRGWPAWLDDTTIVFKCSLLRCTALLIEDLATTHESALSKPIASEFVVTILISLLIDVSRGEPAVKKTAHRTLQRVAKVMKCSNERTLIFRHLNYLMSRLIQNLEEPWAGDVLGFIISGESDDVSIEATALLESSIREISDNLSGAGDARVLRSLAATHTVLSTAVKRSNAVHDAEANVVSSPARRSSHNPATGKEGISKLRRKLFYYCTDDIEDYVAPTAPKPDESLGDPASSTEEEQQGDGARNSFEAVAQHALVGVQDLLVGRSWAVRATALTCATQAVQLLQGNEKLLLPYAAKILPLLPDQFDVLHRIIPAEERLLDKIKQRKIAGREDAQEIEDLVKHLNHKGAELPVVKNACLLLSAFAQCAGPFIQDRFIRLIFPKMRPLLRLAACFPSLTARGSSPKNGTESSPPSYGAMAASDACLEALCAMANVLPESLIPHSSTVVKYIFVFFEDNEGRRGENYGYGGTNMSMVRYEKQRWQRRAIWAERIVQSQKTVNPGAVIVSLLCHDELTTEVAHPVDMLHTLKVRKNTT